ncbi:MAG: FAD-dependent monooxygenase [Chloroflexi bacterium]|nr:FAD-dependent monooxygenase [Chloroflexota bacterium]MCI0580872.1 FAD-dependent monooxygenase [Chloroflexota bacterium]MCI0648253.1 FAD-dependent monooxygenase [Chloroflexota bacterium]MCI0725927.1 FAD-dependent monooxygenase [Chloroflexota bacterium]
MTYDLIIVGGGLAGSSLAKAMAESGARVLVLERERRFQDRVRGEGMHPWGVAEARTLGLYAPLKATCAQEARWWATYTGSELARRRDLVETTTHRAGALGFYHPQMQEVLLRLAARAGAEVRRGITVTRVCPGQRPTVFVEGNGASEGFEARLVVGADGRQSKVRQWGGFEMSRDLQRLLIAGVLFTGMPAADDTVHIFRPATFGQGVLLFPLGGERFRVYFATGRRSQHGRLSGRGRLADFINYCVETGVPPEWFAAAEVGGPLASFEGAAFWSDHPYQDGVVLVGDAAAVSDPCWGCGLSLTLRDARVLRDQLLATDDWDAAAHQYAAEHDRYYGALHTIESWLTEILYGLGPEADRLREHALPQFANGSGPDLVGAGPDSPTDEAARLRFLGV